MPVPYSGQTLTIRVRATDPVSLAIISDAACTAYFYAPPKDPAVNPSDRTPDETVSLTFDPVSNYYLVSFSTTGWAAGTWWCQPAISGGAGDYGAWTYISFPLAA